MGKRNKPTDSSQPNQSDYWVSNSSQKQPNVRDYSSDPGVHYTEWTKKSSGEKKPNYTADYDMNKLMDKLGDKMPPGIKQMMEQFISIIPGPGGMNSPNFKKEMKKKLKGLSSTFKSPYE